MRRARIVCTLGPATGSERMLEKLLRAGMDVARLNMSYGTHEEHRGYIARLRALGKKMGRPAGILLDLQGVKIRISDVKDPGVLLKGGSRVWLRQGDRPSTAETVFISYARLLGDVREGHRVLVNDGLVELLVTGRKGNALEARVRRGGFLTSRKGVNLPDSVIRAGSITTKDLRDLQFGIEEGVDAFALSFVTRARDVSALKRHLDRAGCAAPIIAKIERPSAVDHIEEILNVADGIMVARGDLGVELSAAAVPILQKDLIRRANRKQRLVITATQMLESMRTSPVPTRAEAADVANAILDGSDAVMLSGETSVGRYPVETVKTMEDIILEAEGQGSFFQAILPVPEPVLGKDPDRFSFAVAHAAVRAAADIKAKCIVAFTRSGYTAGLLAKFRPGLSIVAFTSDTATINRMKFYWGVVPHYMKHLGSTDAMIGEVERTLMKTCHVKRGDDVIITASLPMADTGKTNFLKVHRIS
ncbi:MAG: pyruvate kinase [bacterium]|nr:pyruvate kinase [bacterium]MDT8366381.1 pyruvate kinase [bacterium]